MINPHNLRLWVLFAVLVLIMQFSDPLGDVALGDAARFWGGRLVGVAASLFATEWLFTRFLTERWASPAWLKPAVLSILVAVVPMTMVESAVESVVPQTAAFDDSALREVSPLLAFIGEYLTIVSVVLPLNILLWVVLNQRREFPVLAAASDSTVAVPDFLGKTHGILLQSVIALSAEEHYVRVWTKEHSELVYGRFGDFVGEMPAATGMQVHRSWWVATAGVVTAKRGTRRYELELVNGTGVPVSDRFVRQARAAGLLKPSGNAVRR